MRDNENIVDLILFELTQEVLICNNSTHEGYEKLKSQIKLHVENKQPIRFILPAFPCKSVNRNKVLGTKPDMGEYLAIKKLVKTIRNIESIYPQGSIVTIFSDYHTFSEFISVDLTHHYQYSEGLKQIINSFNASDIIAVTNFQHFQEFAAYEVHEYSDALRALYGDKQYQDNFDNLLETDENVHLTYIGMKRFMCEDQRPLTNAMTKKERNQRISDIAKGMMLQGKALDKFLAKHYDDYIRLSIHDHPFNGSKYSVALFEKSVIEKGSIKTPWHNTVLFDTSNAQFSIAPLIEHQVETHIGSQVLLPVQYKNSPWLLIKLSSAKPSVLEQYCKLELSLIRHQCGLIIDGKNTGLSLHDFDNNELTALNKQFGVVVLRNFERFHTSKDYENWYQKRGKMIPWKFGFTHVVAPEIGHQGKPPSSVDSEEGLPIHWDLNSPPAYMNIDQSIHKYSDYTPREFTLYCHRMETADPAQQGLSLLVDTLNASLSINGHLRESLRNTHLSYFTEQSYFGGIERVYPIVMHSKWLQEDIIRWWEVWDSKDHPNTIQPNYSKIVDSPEFKDMAQLEKILRAICMSESNMFKLAMQPGDAILINNETMLHGRTEFKGYRELWRIQLQPPAINSPFKHLSYENQQLYRKRKANQLEAIV
ncbi:L-tyrosine/L-tryptophan isonitrile synthase family protein [Paraneptunicella aestuarii]|uniref:L-tyrosine/L-tryptophan isonitrile synthase family protein n=1 Tax=Paraneptunicella aestuarii TaxID=2831148 RepID=UPI001E2E2D0F|nr:L-tyrosine/L-tryptophan isonitrile synthase family protein [Paraneptunicella aestuarii]UAA40229.1 L-tyrosine/L-tryptophan isonitrile synthase family protein [Paraneptunicella aestuarii]